MGLGRMLPYGDFQPARESASTRQSAAGRAGIRAARSTPEFVSVSRQQRSGPLLLSGARTRSTLRSLAPSDRTRALGRSHEAGKATHRAYVPGDAYETRLRGFAALSVAPFDGRERFVGKRYLPHRRGLERAEQREAWEQSPGSGQDDAPRDALVGDIMIDGAELGAWLTKYLADELMTVGSGTTGLDGRLGPPLPGSPLVI
jgi:hypothetical protein